MAAGNGSRYGALKQFDKLGPENEYLFEFAIFDAIQNNFDHIVVVTKKQFIDDIFYYLQDRIPKHVKLDVINQSLEDLPKGFKSIDGREKPWGTAHAVWAARNYIDKSFVVLNADDYYGKEPFKIAAKFISSNIFDNQFGLISYALVDTLSDYGSVSRGICEVEHHQLIHIKELTKIQKQKNGIVDLESNIVLTGNEPASMNFWICKQSVFQAIEEQFIQFLSDEEKIKNSELYIPMVIQRMIDEKKIQVKIFSTISKWFGITYVSDKKQAINTLAQMANNNEYPSPLWKK